MSGDLTNQEDPERLDRDPLEEAVPAQADEEELEQQWEATDPEDGAAPTG